MRSIGHVEEAPHDGVPTVAFIGRSNVGKSSLLNALVGGHVARTSQTPGRTQRIHLYDVQLAGAPVRFADLPGYGYARVPAAVRRAFGPMIEGFLLGAPALFAVLLLVDARREPDRTTADFVSWLLDAGLPMQIVATKSDKVPRNRRGAISAKIRKGYGLPTAPLLTSAAQGEGIDELRQSIAALAEAAGGPQTP